MLSEDIFFFVVVERAKARRAMVESELKELESVYV
jgi:hypothetical protein